MNEHIKFVGEHLLGGQLGYFFIFLAFVAALLAMVSYFFATQKKDLVVKESWRRLGRIAYSIHSVSVIGIVITLFLLIFNHRFEYYYVWEHSNRALPVRYMLACFWEGQEGSFLLWIFWHVVIGNILIRTAKEWESPVMAIISLVQVFLTSMILGIYFFGYHIGSDPFILLRHYPSMQGLPFTHDPKYLATLDGKGLNPLLQNYWMTIHPPTLFCGFALTLVPFAFAIAGIWQKKYKAWIDAALPWTFIGIMILGTGVLMGGAWAYETLSFGGFWAWDPVENSSLVPWIILVGAGHLMLISKQKGKQLFTTFLFSMLAFLLVLYSTYMTRSGILGDTSVHSFTGEGMSAQLLTYLFFFLIGAIVILAISYKKIPRTKEETLYSSREFWMFVGSVILLLSAFQILSTTSIPVYNAVFGTNIAPPAHPKLHYNQWQVPFATVICLMVGFAQYFAYRKSDVKKFFTKISFSVIVSLVATILAAIFLKFPRLVHYFLFFATIFCAIANFDYLLRTFGKKINKGGASIAHIGFALIILGALLTNGKKQIISRNTSGVQFNMKGESTKDANNNNIMLIKQDTVPMAQYYVTYTGMHKNGLFLNYPVKYYKKINGKYVFQFQLDPRIQLNKEMGNVAIPSTKHFLAYDIFTHITYANIDAFVKKNDSKYTDFVSQEVSPGDTIFTSNSMLLIDNLTKTPDTRGIKLQDSDIAVGANITVTNFSGFRGSAHPFMLIRHQHIYYFPDTVKQMGIIVQMTNLNPNTGKIKIAYKEKKANQSQFVIMKAMIFPFINVLWAGVFIMIIGIILSVVDRIRVREKMKKGFTKS